MAIMGGRAWRFAIGSSLLLAGCATIVGLDDPLDVGPRSAGIDASLDGDPDGGADGNGPPVDANGSDVSDTGTDAAGVFVPAADAGVPTAYAVSGRLWTVRLANNEWSSFGLPSATCPTLDEVAVDGDGKVFVSGPDGLYVYAGGGCTRVGNGAGPFPNALAFVSRGVLVPGQDVLVGYMTNGDYVRVDTTTAAVTVTTPGALAGITVGDLVVVGAKGYVVMRGDVCSTQDCIWGVDLSTGRRVGTAPSGTLPTSQPFRGLAHWSGKVYAFTDNDTVFVLDPTNPSGATVFSASPPGFFDVGFKGAGSHAGAPIQ
jgi:hypothetical protein